MTVAEYVSELERDGIHLWEEAGQLRFRAPRGVMTDERKRLLGERKQAVLDHLRRAAPLTADAAHRHDPFPLTDVQAAYLLGRGSSFAWGGVACHAYAELRFASLDVQRLEAAWRRLIARHDMLRAVIEPDGSQRVLAEVPPYCIDVIDARQGDGQAAIAATREVLSHQQLSPRHWPLFDLRVTLAPAFALLHFSIDFLIADYVSIHLLLEELHVLYQEPATSLAPLPITFRDLLLWQRSNDDGRRQRDRDWWWARLDELPPAPRLPLAPRALEAPPRFFRRELRLAREEWRSMRQNAAAFKLTPSAAVLAVYAGVIARWSRHPRFTLDITLLSRPPLVPESHRLVGDFTAIDVLAVEIDPGASFRGRAGAIQAQLMADLDHSQCSGVEVLRELARRRGHDAALMPVVFTSGIGLADEQRERAGLLGVSELVYGISQTPQVWIDCQVMERGGGLSVNWDVREGVFPDGVVDDMFGVFGDGLRALADGGAWDVPAPDALPPAHEALRRRANDTGTALPSATLHGAVLEQAARTPQRTALIAGGGSLTYGELAARAGAVAALVAGEDLVAVVMDRGWEQAVAALGVLAAGAAYLPVDTTQPVARRDALLAAAGVHRVLTQSHLAAGEWPAGLSLVVVDRLAEGTPPAGTGDPDARAYAIYTSGSTGTPKAVAVSHRAALNTIEDINRRFAVGAGDCVLGVAQLGFDLSVYDLFGPLSVGGCLVMPAHDRGADPSHWAQLIEEHGVTVWNSVPAQMQMLSDYLRRPLPSLRLALLSGDWIPVSLPGRVRAQLPGARLVSLGGATEAAIWSIAFPIDDVDPTWRSIPYGRPLANQRFEVLDETLRPCPVWGTGELYIGGHGLAQGYLGDEARTAERFIRHPATGERLYRTGDFGRWLPDGNIELLGREDLQVKIRGHRIELGEVEAVLQAHQSVARAVVLVDGESTPERRLVAVVESARRPAPDDDDWRRRVAAEAAQAGDEVVRGMDVERYRAYTCALDRLGALAMARALRELGLFTTAQTQPEILARVAPRHQRLVRRWLRALEAGGWLQREGDTWRGLPAPDLAAMEDAWRELRAWDGEDEVVRYFRECARQLPALMRGDAEPLHLLFPQGGFEFADALYGGALFNRWANAAAGGALRQIAAEVGRPLKVLEVGAGAGTTSAAMLAALRGEVSEYVVSDLSTFFVSEARRRLGERPRLRHLVFDFDRDFREQALQANHFDVIIAGDSLHAARDLGRTLPWLRELLTPGGALLVLEMTRDHLQIMTSLELMVRVDQDGRDFADGRRGRDQTFLSPDEWLAALGGAGAVAPICLRTPEALDETGMRVFVARFKSDRVCTDTAALLAHAAALLPESMVPAAIHVADELPLTGNGKLDRRAVSALLPRVTVGEAAAVAPPASDLERRVAAIWAAVLARPSVGRDEDFFALGGDSLLAARLVGALIEQLPEAAGQFFDELLRSVLELPTVALLAERLAAPVEATAAEAVARPALRRFGGGGAPLVLVHGASGLGLLYRHLVAPLAVRAAVWGLDVADHDGYLAASGDALLQQLAAGYVRLLREQVAEPPYLVGAGWGALLAAELACQIVESGGAVAGLAVVAGLPPSPIEDDAAAEELFQRELGGAVLPAPEHAAAFARYRHTLRTPASRIPMYAGDLLLLLPREDPRSWCDHAEERWRDACLGEVRAQSIPGDPSSCLWEANAAVLAELLGRRHG